MASALVQRYARQTRLGARLWRRYDAHCRHAPTVQRDFGGPQTENDAAQPVYAETLKRLTTFA
jgi:hypothetical protein